MVAEDLFRGVAGSVEDADVSLERPATADGDHAINTRRHARAFGMARRFRPTLFERR